MRGRQRPFRKNDEYAYLTASDSQGLNLGSLHYGVATYSLHCERGL